MSLNSITDKIIKQNLFSLFGGADAIYHFIYLVFCYDMHFYFCVKITFQRFIIDFLK